MTSENRLYQVFLEEMQQLEKFRSSQIAHYGDTPIDSEDPYTKRLIEALAFFGARARIQGTEKITEIHQRLFRQYFPYLVHPIPAFAMLQMKPSIRYPEKVVLSAGYELIFKTANNQKATFQILDDVTIFPFTMKAFEFCRNGSQGWQCSIGFVSPHTSNDEIGFFRLYINHLNSFISSLSIALAMQYSLEKVQVFYNDDKVKGKKCSITYGHDIESRNVFSHVIEQIRSLLHFPQQELFINIEIPPLKKRWDSFTLVFDFNSRWPEAYKLNSESLIPYVVPIINLKKSFAEPILDEGTRDSFPVLYPEPIHQFELHTVLNVREILPSGTRSITPGLLGIDDGGSYEVDYFKKEVILDLPHAFQDPKTVSIEAHWTQPWFSNYIHDELDLIFTEAQTFGISVRLLGSIHRYESTINADPNFLIKILSLKNQAHLTLNEILFLMNVMKNLHTSYFDFIPSIIKDLKINEKFDSKKMNSAIEYEFFLKDIGGHKWELIVLFFKYLNDFLNCWLPTFELQTKVHLPNQKKPLIYKQGEKNELSILARNFFFSE